MGCNCGGTAAKKYYLVTMHGSGERKLYSDETQARIAITANGGGGWVEVGEEQRQELVNEGVPVG